MKKIVLLFLALSMLLIACSCGETENSVESKEPITTEEFLPLVKAATVEGDSLLNYPSNYLLDMLGIEADTYGSFFFLQTADTTNSYETVAVFVATSNENAEGIKTAIQTYLDSLTAQFANYNATINDMVSKAVLKAEGNKVYFVISANVNEVKNVIAENLSAYN